MYKSRRNGQPPSSAGREHWNDEQQGDPNAAINKIADNESAPATSVVETTTVDIQVPANKGKLITDATVAPQNITYPTDLKLLNAARQKSEELIDVLYNQQLHGQTKVRTYRQMARKDFLNTAKKKLKQVKPYTKPMAAS